MNKIQQFANVGLDIIKSEIGGAVKSLIYNRSDTLLQEIIAA